MERLLDISIYNQSIFLFGPRQVGKTYLIKSSIKADLYLDLLKPREFFRYAQDPELLFKETSVLQNQNSQVVIDEIQRCPELLNVVQSILSEAKKIRFILTGSSARRLKRGTANLLGGRALTLHLYPLTGEEMGAAFSLGDSLRFGSLPPIFLEPSPRVKIKLLQSYVETYLKEEIQQEALTRNIPAFAKFLELAAFENGNLLNFNNLAREVGIGSKTIKEYFQILEDTLLGFYLYPFTRSHREKLVSHPKFYFFDPGVVSALRRDVSTELLEGTPPYGRAFEHWVILETMRLLDYRGREAALSFFRTTDGAEVDLILEKGRERWAIEIKANANPSSSDLRGLKSFLKDHTVQRALCVCQTPRPYQNGPIEFLPWQEFLKQI